MLRWSPIIILMKIWDCIHTLRGGRGGQTKEGYSDMIPWASLPLQMRSGGGNWSEEAPTSIAVRPAPASLLPHSCVESSQYPNPYNRVATEFRKAELLWRTQNGGESKYPWWQWLICYVTAILDTAQCLVCFLGTTTRWSDWLCTITSSWCCVKG
jgi:hypothetical protein